MKTNKVTAIVVGALLLFGVAWFPLMPSAQPEAPEVGIGTFSQAIDYGPMYVARHFRWFEQAIKKAGAGAPVYLELGGFDEIQTAFAQRKLHAFFSAEAPVIKLVSEGQAIRIVEIGCTLQQEVLVRKDRHVNSIADLKGKAIAVAEGTSSHFGLLKILSSAGLSSADVTLRPGFPGDVKPLFETGGVDAWAVWPPFVEEQIIAGRGFTLPGGNAKIQSVMSLHRDIIKQNPKMAQALVSTMQRAKRWIGANPDEAKNIVAQAIGLDRAVVDRGRSTIGVR
jgi:sulfonate transport system substrate-binding protein